jgi:hypothetical protein
MFVCFNFSALNGILDYGGGYGGNGAGGVDPLMLVAWNIHV